MALLRIAKVSLSPLQSSREQRSISIGKNCLLDQHCNDVGEQKVRKTSTKSMKEGPSLPVRFSDQKPKVTLEPMPSVIGHKMPGSVGRLVLDRT